LVKEQIKDPVCCNAVFSSGIILFFRNLMIWKASMKILSLLFIVFFISQATAQNTKSRILYSYSFEGLKSSEEGEKLVQEIQKMKDVSECKIIFKGPDHKLSQIKVIVEAMKPKSEKEAASSTGPKELKNFLISKGYTPHTLKEEIL
jgi:hypothetical protein